MQGNHDYLNPLNPFWGFLERIKGIRWVQVPIEGKALSCPPLEALGATLFLPHTSDPEKEWQYLNFKDYKVIFAHNTFVGADLGHGHITSKGPSVDIFSKKNIVISGDVHVPQKVGPVVYVGAPYTVDFGDDYDPRVLIIDTDTKEIITRDCGGPQKVLLEASLADGYIELSDIAEDLGVIPGDVLKVKIYILKSQFAEWPHISKIVREWGKENNHYIHTIQPAVIQDGTDSVSEAKKRRAVERRSDNELLLEYVKKMGVDERTARVGEDLLEQ
jgi:hypothetical protein